jgi:hypothetical protein
MPSPKVEPVLLSDEERQVLVAWSRRRKTAQALAARSRIVLRCAEGGTIGEVAVDLGVSRDMELHSKPHVTEKKNNARAASNESR